MVNRSRCAAVLVAAGLIFMAGCAGGAGDAGDAAGTDRLQVVTSFSILTDMVEEVGGDRVDVHNLVPIGTDPHEYTPEPDDIKQANDADAVFYNGLNLEGGRSGWFAKLMDAVDQDEDRVYNASAGVEPMYLTDENGKDEQMNPHAFIDPSIGVTMVENVRDGLIEADPDHETEFTDNADEYLAELTQIVDEYETKFDDIPQDQRILITSERAYQYLADRYDLHEGYLWEIDTEENGTPDQITALVDFIADNPVPGLFVESNVDRRPMESVADEIGVQIEGELYSDEIGKPGSDGDTYLAYLQHNIDVIHAVLADE